VLPLRVLAMSLAAFIAFPTFAGRAAAPAAPQDGAASSSDPVARGQYIVNGVAVCWRCHTPQDEDGEPDQQRWLLGGPVPFEPARQIDGWAQVAPRLAGLPPGSDEEFIRLMMTGISRTGSPPRRPMPQFRMSRADAEAVLAYLKSLKSTE